MLINLYEFEGKIFILLSVNKMKMKTKKAAITVIVVIVVINLFRLGGVILCNHIFHKENASIEAISYLKALTKVYTDDNYFIIYLKKGFFDDAASLYYFDGKKRETVILTGKDPFEMHSENGNAAIFCGEAGNQFLVKGEILEQYKDIVEETVIKVESWDIIYPIKRAYGDEYNHRYLYPANFIDDYDVERGDFIPDTIGDKALYFFEAEYYLNNESGYMLVSPKTENGETQWYICEDGIPNEHQKLTGKIKLSGNLPGKEYDKFLDEKVYKDESGEDGYRHYRNFLLIKGKYENEIFKVESWEFVKAVYRMYDDEEKHTVYYFDERDFN